MQFKSLFASAAAPIALLWPSITFAETASQQAVDEVDGEILVTARKRAEGLQDTPVSVTAFTSQMMERQGITDITDVARRTPGLQYGEFGDIKLSPTSLRGIYGSAGSAGADPAVGYYIDEIFIGQGAGASVDLYDIERVEVLRGPQGTLFGRNTIGGVISITTKRPTDHLVASFTAGLANYDGRRLGASISGPLIGEAIKAKLAVVYNKRDGTSRNILLGRDVNNQDALTLRGQLEFDLGSAGSLLLTSDYRRVRQEPLMFETLKYNDNALVPQLLDLFDLPRNSNPYDRRVIGDDPSRETLNAEGLSATWNGELLGIKLTNIASYRYHDYYSRTDTDRTPLRIAYDGDPEKVHRFSEELRADFTIGRIDWLAGLYYYWQNSSNLSFIEIGADAADLLGVPEYAGSLAGSDATLRTTSLAGFLSGTWRATDRLDITIGGRYTHDRKRIRYSQNDPLGLLGGTTTVPIMGSKSWAEFTPNFNIRFKPSDDVMVYATASKGFKSGGFNDALGEANGIEFDPEALWNYEAGIKVEALNRKLAISLAVYEMRWSQIQITQDDPTTPIYDPIILNGGRAHSRGIEFEATARPTSRLNISANMSLTDAGYDGGTLPTGEPLRRIPFAPDYTASVNVEQSIPIDKAGDLSLLAELILRGESYLTPNNDLDGRVSPYGLVNFRASFRPEQAPWRITLWAKNVANKTYTTRLFDSFSNDLIGQKFIILGDPRTYGVELKFDF